MVVNNAGDILGQAQGKLTSCDDDFAHLDRKYFVLSTSVQKDFDHLWKPSCWKH